MRLIFILIIFTGSTLMAQENLEFGNTGTTTKSPKYKPKHREHKSRHLISWIKNDSRGLLLGNKCMRDVTHKMGFQYVVQPRGQAGNRSEFGRLMHNFFAKIGIFFRNGPFWKIKLKKKKKECRKQTGDFVG